MGRRLHAYVLYRGKVKKYLMCTYCWSPEFSEKLLSQFSTILLADFIGMRFPRKTADKVESAYWDQHVHRT